VIIKNSKQYAIVVNPFAGRDSVAEKRQKLRTAARILKSSIQGLDVNSFDEFIDLSRQLSASYSVLVVAGGDGSFSEVMNAVDLSRTILAFLPMGSGNALQYSVYQRKGISDIARQIRSGVPQRYDLIDCGGKKFALIASVGLEAEALRLVDGFLKQNAGGFAAYLHAALTAYFSSAASTPSSILYDGREQKINNLISFIVTKLPYYGYGMKIMPGASMADALLHTRYFRNNVMRILTAAVLSFSVGNRVGQYARAREVRITSERPLWLQIDGNLAWPARKFHFRVAPGMLRLISPSS
jgi:diacylglycerol kinase family enzyme